MDRNFSEEFKNQFVGDLLELKLIELGFPRDSRVYLGDYNNVGKTGRGILWQQAQDWFREKFGLNISIGNTSTSYSTVYDVHISAVDDHVVGKRCKTHSNLYSFKTYEAAREAGFYELVNVVYRLSQV